MRNIVFVCLLSLFVWSAGAQNGDEVFRFLRYPSSTRANALGGHTVALVERDPSLAFHNPALLGGEMDGMVNLNYMNYIADINIGSALFAKAWRDRGAWGVGATFLSNGTMKEVNSNNEVLGEFSAKDVGVQGFFSYDLSDKWRGGASLKLLYSSLADYTSMAMAVDVGLSYYDSEKAFSAGLTFKNIGAQLKPYEETRQKMPWDIQLGLTKRMTHAPIRFSLTAMYLNRWNFDYVDDANKAVASGDNFFQTLAKHFVLGIDYIPSDNFWIGVGFNPKTRIDMKLHDGGTGLSGFSAGAGVKIKMFDVGVSLAKYHPSAMSMMLSVSTTLGDFK